MKPPITPAQAWAALAEHCGWVAEPAAAAAQQLSQDALIPQAGGDAAPRREPMTEAEICRAVGILNQPGQAKTLALYAARAVEKHHGIVKQKPTDWSAV